MRALVVVAALVGLSACGVTEGPLLRAKRAPPSDAGGDGSLAPVVDAGPGMPPSIDGGATGMPAFPHDVRWQYQLVGTVDPMLDAQLFVVDLFNVSSTVIDRLHAQRKQVVAYLSAGTLESFRDDADQFPSAAVGKAWPAYPNESWLDVRDPGVRVRMAARLDVARDKGFDGVLPTNLSAFTHDSGFDLDARDQADYALWISEQVRARGMHVGMPGDYADPGSLVASFDWMVDFGCIESENCERAAPFAAAGKPVLDVETEGEIATICTRAQGYGVNVILKRPDLGAYRVVCP